jgi:endo-1,4-beta-xylanase
MMQMPHLGRRTLLAASAAGLALRPGEGRAAPPASSPTRARLPLGCAVQRNLLDDPAYRAAILAHFDMVVTEDALKWERLRPNPRDFDFADADAIVGFARAAGLAIRGHALVFHGQVPKWLDEMRTRGEAEEDMRRAIATIVGRYRGVIGSWDVVNEFTDDRPEAGTGLRRTIWERLIGDDYIAIALRTAAEADPSAQLVLSDYFLEYEGRHYDSRRAVMLRVVRDLVRRGVPLHAVGMQGHLYGDRVVDRAAVARFVADLRALGIDVIVTELDIVDQAYPADVAIRDRLAAQQAFELLDAVTEGGGMHSLLTWGVSDRNSWTSWHKPRADGLPTRPLALDTAWRPKPLMHVLQHFRRRVVAASPAGRQL